MHVEAMTRFIPREILAGTVNPRPVETAAPETAAARVLRAPAVRSACGLADQIERFASAPQAT